MNDIEIGDYVRTKSGEIGIFVEYRDDKFFCKIKIKNTYYTPPISTITKHSKNIIDLIEVGDFVNGNIVTDKYLFAGEMPVVETSGVETNAKCLCEKDIQLILTHEQYSQNPFLDKFLLNPLLKL